MFVFRLFPFLVLLIIRSLRVFPDRARVFQGETLRALVFVKVSLEPETKKSVDLLLFLLLILLP